MKMDFLNHPETDRIILAALAEDLHDGDHTTLATIPADARRRAKCLIKDEGILAGVHIAERIFRHLDPSAKFELLIADGSPVRHGDIAFYVEAQARAILSGERVMLNILQRMSGIATKTRHLVGLIEGTGCRLLDTRKTTPLIRHFEKWAVHIGGAVNHRFGLYDMIMIKDNHADYAGGTAQAIQRVHDYLAATQRDLKIEVEARNLAEVEAILAIGGIHRIMLDNMDPDTMRQAVQLIGGRYETEGSGNITEENVRAKAETGVDFLSIGALTHSVRSLDISFKAV